jgi:hypothetical protein
MIRLGQDLTYEQKIKRVDEVIFQVFIIYNLLKYIDGQIIIEVKLNKM